MLCGRFGILESLDHTSLVSRAKLRSDILCRNIVEYVMSRSEFSMVSTIAIGSYIVVRKNYGREIEKDSFAIDLGYAR